MYEHTLMIMRVTGAELDIMCQLNLSWKQHMTTYKMEKINQLCFSTNSTLS